MSLPDLNATLTQRNDINPALTILRIAPDGWELPDFEPGQFAVIGLPGSAPRCPLSEVEEAPAPPDKLIRRAYSIASSSLAREYLELYVALVGAGALTPRLFALEPGDRLWLGPRFTGLFTLASVPAEKHVVLVATGTGLAPYMSMLRSELICGGSRRFAVLLGARHSSDLGYHAPLVTLQRQCENFRYLPILSRPASEPVPWGGPVGHVQDLWKGDALAAAWGARPTPEDTHVFLCGNPAMVEEMVPLLAAEGFREHSKTTPGQVHVERYW